MKNRFLAGWILANGLGMALGFWTFLNLLMAIAFGVDFEKYWSETAVEEIENAEQILRWGPRSDCRWPVRSLGFVVPLLAIWSLTAVWGDLPGPIEPFTIVGGGLAGVAVLQWWSLRRKGMTSRSWLILWCLGLPLGMVAFMAAYMLLDAVFMADSQYSIGWVREVGLIGFAIGTVAAATSGPSLLKAIADGAS